MATVIKFKYGDTVRRISGDVVDLHIDLLRELICALFDLDLDANFTITYIDEDDDVITLCDDLDLLELGSQSLNPIKVTVTLDPETDTKSSENSNQIPIQSLNAAVSTILKFVPERKHTALLKLLLDVAWENMMGVESDMKDQTVKKDGVLKNVDLNVPYSESEAVQFTSNDMDVKRFLAASLQDDMASQLKKSVDLKTCVDLNECPFIGMRISSDSSTVTSRPCGTRVSPFKRAYFNDSKVFHEDIKCDGCGIWPITGPRFTSKWKGEFDLCLTCFKKTGHDEADYIRMDFSPTSKESSSVCNDEIDPEVVNPKMEQVCEKKSNNGVVEGEDLFFDAQPHGGKAVEYNSPSKVGPGLNQDQESTLPQNPFDDQY